MRIIEQLEELHDHVINKIDREQYILSLLGTMLDATPDMIWVKDMEHRFIIANKSLMRRLLLTNDRTDVIGKTSVEIALKLREQGNEYHCGEACLYSDIITLEKGTSCTFLEDFLINGNPVYLEVIKTPFKDANGNIIGTVGVGRDLTEDVLKKRELFELCKNKNCETFEKEFSNYCNKYYFSGDSQSILVKVKK